MEKLNGSTHSIRSRHCDPDSRVPCHNGRSAGCTGSASCTGIRHDDKPIRADSVCTTFRPSCHHSRRHRRNATFSVRTACWYFVRFTSLQA